MKNNSHRGSLIGCQVSIGIGEPWEFEDEVGSSKFIGIITDVYVSTHFRQSSEKENEYLIVHLARPFVYNKLKNEYFICSPRHEGNGLRELAKGGVVSFNFYRASSERAKSETPFDSTRWKDDRSFGLIGTLKIENHTVCPTPLSRSVISGGSD